MKGSRRQCGVRSEHFLLAQAPLSVGAVGDIVAAQVIGDDLAGPGSVQGLVCESAGEQATRLGQGQDGE